MNNHHNLFKWRWFLAIIAGLTLYQCPPFNRFFSQTHIDDPALDQITALFNQIDLKAFDLYVIQNVEIEDQNDQSPIGYHLLGDLKSIKLMKIGHHYFYDEKWIDQVNHQFHVKQSNGLQTINRNYSFDPIKQTDHSLPIVFDEIYHHNVTEQFKCLSNDLGAQVLNSHTQDQDFLWHHALSLKYQLAPQKRKATCFVSENVSKNHSFQRFISKIQIKQENAHHTEKILLDPKDQKIISIESPFFKSIKLSDSQKNQLITDLKHQKINAILSSFSSLKLPTISTSYDWKPNQIQSLKSHQWLIWEVKGIQSSLAKDQWINSRQEIKALHPTSSYPFQWITYQKTIKHLSSQTHQINPLHLKPLLDPQEKKLISEWTDRFLKKYPHFHHLTDQLRQGVLFDFKTLQPLIQSIISEIHLFLSIQPMPFMTELKDIFAFRQGDCNEFSHLFLAIAWDLGMASQLILGLVPIAELMQKGQLQMGYHAWVGVMSLDGWIELDPLWREVPVGVGHLGMSIGWQGYEEIQKGIGHLAIRLVGE